MEHAQGAWHPDPSGRHAQRWWDGTRWTDSVADTAGIVATDPLQPATPAPAIDHTPSVYGPAPGPVVIGGPPLVDRKGRWAMGVLLTAAGAALVAASMFVLDWYDDIGGAPRDFSAARDLFDATGSGGASYSELYMTFGWVIGLIVVGLAVLVAATRAIPMLRLVAGPCGIAALVHTATIVNLYTANFPGDFAVLPGAWVGVAGYAAALAGTFVAASSRP